MDRQQLLCCLASHSMLILTFGSCCPVILSNIWQNSSGSSSDSHCLCLHPSIHPSSPQILQVPKFLLIRNISRTPCFHHRVSQSGWCFGGEPCHYSCQKGDFSFISPQNLQFVVGSFWYIRSNLPTIQNAFLIALRLIIIAYLQYRQDMCLGYFCVMRMFSSVSPKVLLSNLADGSFSD